MKKFLPVLVFTLISKLTLSQSIQLPYFENFETGAPGWLAENKGHSGTIWQLGEPMTGFIVGAYSGNNCWELNLNNYYTESSVCHLLSPVFDFTNVVEAEVSFYTMFKTEYLWDYLTVQYTVDNGNSWIFLPFPFLENPNGYVARWIKSSLVIGDLLGFDEVQFRFTFTSDATVNYDGYAIDDFKISTEPLAVSDLNSDNVSFAFYPNPSNGFLHFNFSDNNSKDGLIRIFDVSGKLCISYPVNPINEDVLDISELSSGVYTVVYDNAEILQESKKLVLVK